MIVIPKPSEEVVERFKKVIGIDPDCEPESLLMSEDHYCALVIVEVGLDDFKRVLHYTENLYAGFWRFNERWVRRKHHVTTKIGIKAGERVFCYSAKRLSNALKVVGKKAHLYIWKWTKKGLKHERVHFTEDEAREVRKHYRGWHEAKLTERKCPKCSNPLLDYGLVHATEGIIQVFRCGSDNCDYVESEIKYTPTQVEALKVIFAPTKHCGKKMRKSWRFCPYCGEEL